MSRYLVFAGVQYYPMGGWDDYIGTFTTYEECMACLKGRFTGGHIDWAHIVDTEGCAAGVINAFSVEDFPS